MSDLVQPDPVKPDRPLNLLLIDDDPIFLMGLRVVIEQYPDLRVVAEATSESDAREILERESTTVDLVILDLGLGRLLPQEPSGLQVCQELKNLYPQLPILLLSSFWEPVLLEAARQMGVEGYCPKGIAVADLINAIRQVGAGQTYWAIDSRTGENTQYSIPNYGLRRETGFFAGVRDRIRASGLRQIEAALAEVTEELRDSRLSVLDRAILAGRRRELLASRRLVNRLLAPRERTSVNPYSREQGSTGVVGQASPPAVGSTSRRGEESRGERAIENSALVRREEMASERSPLFDNANAKIQYGLQNLTGVPLEIDIFREEKKRELLNTVLRKFEDVLDELRFSQVQLNQLSEKRPFIIQDLWQSAATDFFGKYYTLQVGDRDLEVVNTILKDAEVVYTDILEKIPLVTDLLSYVLFEVSLTIDNAAYPYGTPEAMARAELLLQNLVIQVANAVVQPLLNNFADQEIVKQNFYDARIISPRDIERFRNDLSWKYRLERYVGEPTAIFESRYILYVLDGYGIIKVSIYAPRGYELKQLSGIQSTVTLALETRDAIAPRLRSVVAFVGKGVVYVLTQVVGRGIGLIARGILEGIGGSWQESRVGKGGQGDKGKG